MQQFLEVVSHFFAYAISCDVPLLRCFNGVSVYECLRPSLSLSSVGFTVVSDDSYLDHQIF